MQENYFNTLVCIRKKKKQSNVNDDYQDRWSKLSLVSFVILVHCHDFDYYHDRLHAKYQQDKRSNEIDRKSRVVM